MSRLGAMASTGIGSMTVESMIREMLRPMLKDWLDENLPALVERMVALRALPDIIREFPNVVYIVLGQTHPNLLRDEGEAYRLTLERLAKDLGVQKHVVFFNRFVELEELMRFIGAADIYLTPYLTEAQTTSGTLAYAFGAGNAVVSTPYWHAAELLNADRGRAHADRLRFA